MSPRMQQELDRLKKIVAELEQRLAAQEKQAPVQKDAASLAELKATNNDLEKSLGRRSAAGAGPDQVQRRLSI